MFCWRRLGENCYILPMTISADLIASGDGWTASHMRCCAGPGDAAFEEQHGQICVAIVIEGSFNYRSSKGSATLVPGAILLGESGDGFECGHDHSVGDRCIALHFDSDLFESRLTEISGLSAGISRHPALPPRTDHGGLLVHADGLLSGDGSAEEFGYMLLTAVASTQMPERFGGPCSRGKAKRLHDVVHSIERAPHRHQSLSELAGNACMSPYHFLREFKGLTGMTPHQFILSQRLRRAAAHLRENDAPVSEVAFDAGFGDLSEFNRRFRRLIGVTPGTFRARSMRRAL